MAYEQRNRIKPYQFTYVNVIARIRNTSQYDYFCWAFSSKVEGEGECYVANNYQAQPNPSDGNLSNL